MTQPYVYWTLMAPFVTIIGLYSNVEGSLDARGTTAEKWLEDQLLRLTKDAFSSWQCTSAILAGQGARRNPGYRFGHRSSDRGDGRVIPTS